MALICKGRSGKSALIKDRNGRGGDGSDDVGVAQGIGGRADRKHVDAELGGHSVAEGSALGFVAAVSLDTLDSGDLRQRVELGAGVAAGAKERQGRAAGRRQIARGQG